MQNSDEMLPLRAALLTLLLVTWTGTALAQPWVPVRCQDRLQEVESLAEGSKSAEASWREFAESVRRAEPGSTGYAPYPYPRTKAQVIADFEYAFRHILIRDTEPEDMLEGDRKIDRALRRGELRVDVVRVENWDLGRCSLRRPLIFLHLLRLYDAAGSEIARFTVNDTGLWGQSSFGPTPSREEWNGAILDLEDLEEVLKGLGFAGPVTAPQYVYAGGLPVCSPVTPCIAFRSKGDIFLLDGGRTLYELAPRERWSSVLERRAARMKAPFAPDDPRQPWVTVGFAWAPARHVAGPLR